MKTAVLLLCLGVAGIVASPPAATPDLHIVTDYQFNYMSRVQTRTTDVWLSNKKMASRLNDRVTIKREDLGVTWRVDLKAGTYTEDKILPAQAEQPAAAADVHSAGFDYTPEYEWQVRDTGTKMMIAALPCRQFIAEGDADFAFATVTFWACRPLANAGYSPNSEVLRQIRSESARKMILHTLAKQANSWALSVEEKQEPAIAPTMVITVTVKTLEAGPAPTGTFELPPNAKRLGGK